MWGIVSNFVAFLENLNCNLINKIGRLAEFLWPSQNIRNLRDSYDPFELDLLLFLLY